MNKYIKREQMKVIQETLKEFPVLLITGARQTGKTTMLKKELSGYNYVTLDDKGVRIYAEEDPVGFVREISSPVIIDEVQYAPQILEVIKQIVDEKEQKPGMFVLTGSQRFEMMKGVTESLAGRIAVFQLPPLSLREIDPEIKNSILFSDAEITQKDFTKEDILKKIMMCKYPKTISLSAIKIWYESYIKTYVERDVTEIINIKDKGRFKNFLKIIAGRIGQPLNQSDISKKVGVDSKTVLSWIHTLEMSDILFLLYPWHKRESSKVIKTPKIYFIDTGICCYLNDIITSGKLINSDITGSLYENFMVSEIVKSFWNKGERPDLSFWRTYDKKEVDLMVETGSGITAVEFKMTQTPQKKHIRTIRELMEKIPECDKGFVVSSVKGEVKAGAGISYINCAKAV